jgi:Ca2+-binding RTX toxin-like protein
MTLYTSALKPFAFNSTDIRFLLDQVKFRPLYDLAGTLIFNWDGTTNVYTKDHTLIYTATSNDPTSAAAIAAVDLYGTSYQTVTDLAGLRDPSGLDNNLLHPTWGAVDQIFTRSAAADYAHYAPIYSGNAGVYDPNAFAALDTYYKTYSNGTANGSFNINGTLNTNYAITIGGAQHAVDGTAITVNNVVDYTPRMISLATTTAGVTYELWGDAAHSGDPLAVNHSPTEIYYNPANGLPIVTNWGQLETKLNGGLGQVDTQARFDNSAGVGDHFIGGLNPGVSPSNGFFVLFGQFFDHGLDFIDKGGQGATVKITLATTDPLYGMTGADGQPVHEITINRATVNSVDANGAEYVNHTSPFIDQSQTYGSHEQLTTLLRKWVVDPVSGAYHAGMTLFDGQTLATQWKDANGNLTNATLPTLNELRAHVEATGRDGLTWEDVSNYRNRDAAGHVSTGTSGSALILDMNPRFDEVNLHQGDGAQDTLVDAALTTLNTWLSTSAHPLATLTLAPGGVLTLTGWVPGPALTGASALLPFVNFGDFSIKSTITGLDHTAVSNILMASVGDHYIAGDGRVNENFGLTSIHHVFHEEHNYQVGNLMDALHREAISTNNFANLHEFQVDTNGGKQNGSHDFVKVAPADVHAVQAIGDVEILAANGSHLGWAASSATQVTWNLDKMFNASKLVVEMEYQHAAVDQYARNVTPNIQEFVGYSPDKNAAVSLEYAQAAFRFGHSTLRETIDTIDPTHGLTGKIMGYALRDAFLNPDAYAGIGPSAIILGMSHQQMNEVDELVTPALNQGLLGQPLDLAAINIARGRDLGIPTLNDFREAIGLARYTSWTDFGQNMQHPGSVGNFIAAYSFDGNLAKGNAIAGLVDGSILEGSAAAEGFTLSYATTFMSGGDLGFDHIDTWLGGLAEVHQPGGLLGETFDKVFVNQIESLMDGDRFYYLYRLAGQQFAEEVGGGQLKDIVERNTGLTHLNGNIFGYSDKYYDFGATPDLVNTTSNEHKWGGIAGIAAGTIGIYSNGGATAANDGTTVNIGGQSYIQDTRIAATDPLSLEGQNNFVNLDDTPNSGAESNEVIVATKGNDLIYAQGGDDTVYGEDGNDKIYGGYGIDRLYGGNGADYLYGGDNPDLIDGGAGDDFLYGESSGSDINGADQLIGGTGNDYVDGGIGIDKLSGGTGDDRVVGGQDTDPFTHGSDGNDLVEGNSGGDILYGDNGDDILAGGADQDQMFGGNGDDIIRPGDSTGALTIGTDEVLGGDGVVDEGNVPGTIGFDIIDFSDNAVRPGGVKFDLSEQVNPVVTVNGTPTQVQSFQMEGVIGSAGNDTLTGGSTHADAAGNNVVDNDWLIGGSGNDALVGGSGNDVIIGGSIRLDALIGKYESTSGVLSTYDHNNNNDGSTEALQLEDARYQGASHRVGYTDTLATTSINRGIIDTVNNTLGGVDYEKHFTEMLRSDQFKNTVLGDGGATGTDTVILSGNLNDYQVQIVTVAGHNVVRLTDQVAGRDGSDLIIDVANFKFANGTVSFAALLNTRTVSISGPVTVTEGNVGTTNAVFTVTLSGPAPAGGAHIDFATVNGTALAGSDYVAQTGTVNIAAGQTTGTITVAVIGDTVHEATEAFTVALSNPVNAVFGGGATVGTATIIDNDAAPTMSVASLSVTEGDVGTTNATLTIHLSAASSTPTTVNYTTANGTATAGADYAATTGSVTFAAGETDKTVTVLINGDVMHELNETFSLNLTSTDTLNPSAGATVTIVDNDAVPMVSIGNTTVTEGAGAVAHFTVSLSAASSQNVTVAYSTTQGTALNGSDFTATSGTATILAGQTTADVAVNITNNAIHETSPEFFTVNLSAPTNATLGNAQGVGFINDDDAPTLAALTLAPAVLEDGSRIITLAELTAGVSNNASSTLAGNRQWQRHLDLHASGQ